MRFRNLLLIAIAFGFNSVSIARDPDGIFARKNPNLHTWMDGLRSGKGPCCSDADGTALSDVDWQTKDGHYQVRLDISKESGKIDLEWIDVPDDAVITEPNLIGKTMVWPIRGYLGINIRCFMPGAEG